MYELKCFTLLVGKIKPPRFKWEFWAPFPWKINSVHFLGPPAEHLIISTSSRHVRLTFVLLDRSLGESMTEVANYNGGWAFRRRGPLLPLAPSSSPSLGHVTQPLWGSVLSPLK